jgi:hypothetical protein
MLLGVVIAKRYNFLYLSIFNLF